MGTTYGREEARSQTRVPMTLWDQPIRWYRQKNHTVSLVITEAGYIANWEAEKEAPFVVQFLKGHGISSKLVLYIYSEVAYYLS